MRRRHPPTPLLAILGGLASLAASVALTGLGGCSGDPSLGYSFDPTYQTDIRTVHVPIFRNNTFSHGTEIELTDAVIKEIQRTTPWRVAADEASETVLTGTITDARLRSLSAARGSGLVQEQAVSIRVDFEWKDNRTGKVLASRRSFEGAESFIPTPGVGEPLEVGRFATVQELARDIVAELRSGW